MQYPSEGLPVPAPKLLDQVREKILLAIRGCKPRPAWHSDIQYIVILIRKLLTIVKSPLRDPSKN